jgi:hypothetical protein
MDTRDRLLERLLDGARRGRDRTAAPPAPDGTESPPEHLTEHVLARLSRSRVTRARRGHAVRLATAGACTALACLVAARVSDRGRSSEARGTGSVQTRLGGELVVCVPPSVPPDPTFAAWLDVLDSASRR